MKKIPILRYNDIRDLMVHSEVRHWNGIVVDDASLEVMLRIEKTMQRLEVMGDDELRWLWIELKAPGKRNRMEEADVNGNYWYQIGTGTYKGFHYMIINNRERRYIDLRSTSHIGEERVPDVFRGNVSNSLLKLEKYITAWVDNICEDADEYNAYVEKNLPYSKRDGIIRRAEKDSWDINDSIIANYIIPIQYEVAKKYGLKLIDLHSLFEGGEELMLTDGIHPNGKGAARLADIIYNQITEQK